MKNNLKVHRAVHDLTQEELAKAVGVSRQTINAIEKGKYNPSLLVALKIARTVNATVEAIFELEKSD
ncbi:MAG: helix-turn-helix transcriptional regulator [Bacteroidota bacterium]